VIAAGAASPWATRKKITLEELVDEAWIMFPRSNVTSPYIDKVFTAAGLKPPKTSVASFSTHLRMHLLATGRFLTIVQDSVVRYHAERWSLKALPVDMRHHSAPIVSFTLKNRTVSPVVDAFLEQARAVARAIK
jgi:DNA-binding transcriptional LysR family regulator